MTQQDFVRARQRAQEASAALEEAEMELLVVENELERLQAGYTMPAFTRAQAIAEAKAKAELFGQLSRAG